MLIMRYLLPLLLLTITTFPSCCYGKKDNKKEGKINEDDTSPSSINAEGSITSDNDNTIDTADSDGGNTGGVNIAPNTNGEEDIDTENNDNDNSSGPTTNGGDTTGNNIINNDSSNGDGDGDGDGGTTGGEGLNRHQQANQVNTYYIDEKFVGFADLLLDGDEFAVTDSTGTDVYKVIGGDSGPGPLDFIDQLSLQDMRGLELYNIEEDKIGSWFSFTNVYRINDNTDGMAYEVEKSSFLASLFGSTFTVYDGDQELFVAKGDFWGSEFEITNNAGAIVAMVHSGSTSFGNLGDSYELAVVENEADPGLMLCVCIVIDQILNDEPGEINSPFGG